MALILEIVDARGHVARHRLDGVPLTLGRALASDVVLDDPYVDGRHARVVPDERGGWTITDLGSVNGLYVDGARRDAPVALQRGTELRIGRTVLRIRDTEEDVAPALVDEQRPAAATPRVVEPPPPRPGEAAAMRGERRIRTMLFETTRGRLAIIAALVGAFGTNEWLTEESRSAGSSVLAGLFVMGMLLTIWSLVWAASARGADRRFRFLPHLAVAAASLLAALTITVAKQWLDFLLPDVSLITVLYAVAFLGLVVLVVAGHLGVSGSLPPQRRWRAGLMVAGAIVVLSVLAAIVEDETFSDVAKVEADLKPLAPSLLWTQSVDEFGAVMREAKQEADEAAKKAADS